MSIVLDSIAADLATLTREVPVPTGELGYGTDLSCTSDITEDAAEVDPNSQQAIAEALFRRLSTAQGTLQDDPNYGYDLLSALNRGLTTAEIQNIGREVRVEVMKDDRVLDAQVSVVTTGTTAMSVSVQVAPAVIGLDTFTLTFAVVDGALTMEALS